MKKLFLLIIIILTAISLYAYDDDFVIDSEGNLIGYKGSDNYVIVPEGVKCINATAFENTPFVTDISLPASLESYQYGAFYHITDLKNILVSKNSKFIESINGILYSSLDNNNLRYIYIYPNNKQDEILYLPNYVNGIDDFCFHSSKYLKIIYSTNIIQELGKRSFYNCKNLKKVNIKLNNDSKIPRGCFGECYKLEYIYTKINSEITPLRAIEDHAFSFCENLSYIDFNIKEYIGEFAFTNTKIFSINIDNNTKIHKKAFYLSNINKINIDDYSFSTKTLTLDDIKQKFQNVESDTLTEIYFKGSDGQQHLYNFKTKKKVY